MKAVRWCFPLQRLIAGYLSVASLQSADEQHSLGMKLLSLVYKSIAPGHEGLSLSSLDPGCQRFARELLELAFVCGGLVGNATVYTCAFW